MIEMPECPINIGGMTATDALIGVTPGASTIPVTIPLYGSPTSECTLSGTGYKSIIGIISAKTGLSRDENGQLSDATSIINSINICKPTNETKYDGAAADACAANDSQFIKGVKNEYDYYYELYKHAIRQLVTVLSIPVSTPVATKIPGWTNNQEAIDTYKSAAIALNQNVNDLIYVIDQIAQIRRTQNIPFLTQRVNQLDNSLQKQQEDLMRQRELLSKENQNQMLLMKEMEAYSRHKSKYNNNMLMVYAFLNISALGLLFYVYRS
jgi:ribosomal protein S15P/S13E